MRLTKHLFLTLLLILSGLGFLSGSLNRPVFAEETASVHPVTLYLFWGNGCPHCAQEEKLLKKIQPLYPNLTIKRFEIWGSAKNRDLMAQVGEKLNTDIQGVPFTLIGKNYTTGYLDENTTGAQIQAYINECSKNECPDIMADLLPPEPTPSSTPIPVPQTPKSDPWKNAPVSIPREVNFPLIGKINLTGLSLPLIAVVIGTLDGFNPCAMWTLLFLISLLVNLNNKKRMWLLGATFLLTSGLVYFLFMAAWLNVLLFMGFIVWVRVAIALFALAAGVFSLNKYRQHTTGCIVEEDPKRKKTFEKLKKATSHKNLWMALAGISALAFAVNLVELFCSAGFPAIFTQILALNKLTGIQYYLYIFLYIIFFMLDDMIVFFVAMKTLETSGISTKYAKFSNLIGGILMILIGILLIVKPQYLMFNF